MPAPKKISRENIITAAFEILRRSGIAAVNARSIAKKLHCSTQPIYRAFQNMEELKVELTKAAFNIYIKAVESYMSKSKYSKYKSYGLGFVRMAKDEKQLFRYLYMSDCLMDEPLRPDENFAVIVKTICKEFGYDEKTAESFHYDITAYSYGLAIGMNIGAINLTDEEISCRLETEFKALTYVYGTPLKKPNRLNKNN